MGVLDKLNDKPNKVKYRDEHGTTRVGDALRWMATAGKAIAPEILGMAGTITGVEGLKKLGKAISGNSEMSESDKEYALKQLELDINEAKELTKRWEADMKSDSWMSKNVRPIVVFNFTLMIDVVIIGSMWGRSLGEAYLPLLMTMGVTAIGGYFTLREFGKYKSP